MLSDANLTTFGETTLAHLTALLAATSLISTEFSTESEGDEVLVPVYGAPGQGVRTKAPTAAFVDDDEDNVTLVPVKTDLDAYKTFSVPDAHQAKAERTRFVENNSLIAANVIAEKIWLDLSALFVVGDVAALASLTKDFSTLDRADMVKAWEEAKAAKLRNAGVLWNTTAWAAFLGDTNLVAHPTEAAANAAAEREGQITRRLNLNHALAEGLADNGEQLGGILLAPDAAALAVSPYMVPERNEYQAVEMFEDPESGLTLTMIEQHDGDAGKTKYRLVMRYGKKLLDGSRARRLVDTSIV